MDTVTRFGVSLPDMLLAKFDGYIKRRGYTNRSEALRDLIRDRLVDSSWDSNAAACGVISLFYDHHQRNLQNKLTDIQHDHGNIIISTSHAHVDHRHCLEVIIVRGKAGDIQKLADKLIATKGVLHGKLMKTSSGREV